MATFFMFGKYSQEALKGISAGRTEQAVQLIEKCGGTVKSMHALLGEHDLVFIVEYPGAEQAMQASIGLSKLCGIGFTTAPAVEVEQFDELAGKA